MDGFLDLQQKIDLAKDSDTSVFTEKEVDTEKLTEKREEIKRRELGQYGCAWDRYGLTQSEAKKAGINPQTCEVSLILEYHGGWRQNFSVPVKWIVEIAPYVEKIDLKFGFEKIPKKFDNEMLKAYWILLYLYIRKGITSENMNSRISANAFGMAGKRVSDVIGSDYNLNENPLTAKQADEIAKRSANSQIRSMIKRFRGKKGEIITIVAMSVITVVYSVLAIAGAITTTGILGGAGGTAAASTSTGTVATGEAAKDVGIIGTLGSGIAKAGDWLVKNGDKIALGKEVYDTVTKGEEETGFSVNEAGQVLEQDKELYGQSQLFKLTGTNAMIAAGIVLVVILGVFIWKRYR